MNGKLITTETMTKIWKLHTNAVKYNAIADILEISEESVRRFVKIMTAAQDGGDVDAIVSGHQRQKDFAKKFFGIEEKKEEIKQQEEQKEEKQTSADADVKEYMQKVLLALAWQNELLERLLDSLGVD